MLDWTGERFIPGMGAEIAYEHYGRYLFASRFVASKQVLDMPSGEGFGSFLLAQTARSVVGMDIDEQAVQHARTRYQHPALDFQWGDMAEALSFPDGSFDIITCFEGIEHIGYPGQQQVLREFQRLLAADGMLFISTPNKAVYTDAPHYHNPYHIHEFYAEEFFAFLSSIFPHIRLLGQMSITGGLIASLEDGVAQRARPIDIDFVLPFDHDILNPLWTDPRQWMYLLAVCMHEPSSPEFSMISHLVADPKRSSIFEALDNERQQLTAAHLAEKSATLAHKEAVLADKDLALGHLQATLHETEATLVHKEAVLADKDLALGHLQATLHETEATLVHKEAVLADKDLALGHLQATLHEMEATLVHKEAVLADKDLALGHLQATLHEMEATLVHKEAVLADKDLALGHLQATLHETEATLVHKEAVLADKDLALGHLQATLHETEATLVHKEAVLADKDLALGHLQATLHETEATLVHKEAVLADKDLALGHLQATLHETEATLVHKEAVLADKDLALGHLQATLHETEATLAQRNDDLTLQRSALEDKDRLIAAYEAERRTFGAQMGRWFSRQRKTWAPPTSPQGKALGLIIRAARILYGEGTIALVRRVVRAGLHRVNPQRWPAVDWLHTSGLFDAVYYLSTYPDVATHRIDPAKHYIHCGWKEGRDPHPLFDTSFYLEQNPDVAQAEVNPLYHYIHDGWKEGRDPHPQFDTSFYLAQNPDVAHTGVNPLWHYVNFGWKEGRDPHPQFDTSFYLEENPDVANVCINPLHHYVVFGLAEGRSPVVKAHTAMPMTPENIGRCVTSEHIRDITINGSKKDQLEPVRLIAFYLPQFHPIPENDNWWGAGFTEWTNVTRAQPMYMGHDQPRRPSELGYYDLRVREVRHRQVELARKYGIYGFCYYYYWFSGRRLLEKPLELMLADKEMDFPFCVCWANENWTRRWDGSEDEMLMEQKYTPDEPAQFIRDLLPILTDERYITVDGLPLLLIYRPAIIPEVQKVVHLWRKTAEQLGVPSLRICGVQSFGYSTALEDGLDAMVEFPPHSIGINDITDKVSDVDPHFRGKIYSYPDIVKYCVGRGGGIGLPVYRGLMTGWDNTARRGYTSYIFRDATPEHYEVWLRRLIAYTCKQHRGDHRLIFINAWNEWAEGTYLEPDEKYQYGYLEATARAVFGVPEPKSLLQTLCQITCGNDEAQHILGQLEHALQIDDKIINLMDAKVLSRLPASRNAYSAKFQPVEGSNSTPPPKLHSRGIIGYLDTLPTPNYDGVVNINNAYDIFLRGWVVSTRVKAEPNSPLLFMLTNLISSEQYVAQIHARVKRDDVEKYLQERRNGWRPIRSAYSLFSGYQTYLSTASVPPGSYKLDLVVPFPHGRSGSVTTLHSSIAILGDN